MQPPRLNVNDVNMAVGADSPIPENQQPPVVPVVPRHALNRADAGQVNVALGADEIQGAIDGVIEDLHDEEQEGQQGIAGGGPVDLGNEEFIDDGLRLPPSVIADNHPAYHRDPDSDDDMDQ